MIQIFQFGTMIFLACKIRSSEFAGVIRISELLLFLLAEIRGHDNR